MSDSKKATKLYLAADQYYKKVEKIKLTIV